MKEIQWRNTPSNDFKVLYVNDNGQWVHYTKSVVYTPDYPIESGSKGFATMQNALRCGYVYVKSEPCTEGL